MRPNTRLVAHPDAPTWIKGGVYAQVLNTRMLAQTCQTSQRSLFVLAMHVLHESTVSYACLNTWIILQKTLSI